MNIALSPDIEAAIRAFAIACTVEDDDKRIAAGQALRSAILAALEGQQRDAERWRYFVANFADGKNAALRMPGGAASWVPNLHDLTHAIDAALSAHKEQSNG